MIKLYPNCIPVEGYFNIVVYDLDRQNYESFPKTIFFKKNQRQFEFNNITKEGVDSLNNKGFLILDEKLIKNQDIHGVENYVWLSPSLINNAIIRLSIQNGLIIKENFIKLIDTLSDMLCKHIFMWVESYISVEDLRGIIDKIETASTSSLQLVLPYHDEYFTDAFGEIVMVQEKISYVIVESSPFEKNIEDKIFFKKRKLHLCSERTQRQFRVNLNLFSESQKHHTYFNRKLYIGLSGEIKNAPECEEEFGYIQEHEVGLKQIVEKHTFQKYWHVHKDLCDVCKDCEYKYMCVDNRLPYQREDSSWCHEEECNYNPYIGKWKGEEGYLSLEEWSV